MNSIDIDYLLKSFSSLMGVPVRRFEEGKEKSFYSLIHLDYDPFLLRQEIVLKIKEDIGYYLDEDDFYYCFLNYQSMQVVIGPTRNTPASEQVLKLMALHLGIPFQKIQDFIHGMSLLATIPYKCVVESLSMLNYLLTGKKSEFLSLDKMQNNNKEEPPLQFNEGISHSSYQVENDILSLIQSGNAEGIKKFSFSIPFFHEGIVAIEALRQNKNMFITTTTLASRTAIKEGIDINQALSLSDYYIRKCESLKEERDVMALSYQMILDYASLVAQKKKLSPLQYQITFYVHEHYDHMITLDELAEYTSLSKSALCLKFKEETSKTINEYIHEIKIAKAKELIKTGLSFSSISYYLGYSSQSHFNRIFLKIEKMTPTEYKKKISF